MKRFRRLRQSEEMRAFVREHTLSVRDLIYPVFVAEGENLRTEIPSMPGVCQYSPDRLPEELDRVAEAGIPAILIFGVPARKDPLGSGAYRDDGITQRAIRLIRARYPGLLVIADVCLCEYTSHGHCGIVRDGKILNDGTLPLLAKAAVSLAASGADIVAPSDMMDGRVAAIRAALDENGLELTPIMSYSAKSASAYYGPFRDAAGSAPQFGDRRSYQMDPANGREALREIEDDLQEGADMIIIKPALASLDILTRAKDRFGVLTAAYNVSGEYAMVKAAAQRGWLDERRVVLENTLSMKRAGADRVITYHAPDLACWLREG